MILLSKKRIKRFFPKKRPKEYANKFGLGIKPLIEDEIKNVYSIIHSHHGSEYDGQRTDT